ncbi:unnamed protein product [Ectocarpus sp. 4 AP-2014]
MMGAVHTEKEDNRQQTFGIETDLAISGMCGKVANVFERPRDIEIEAPLESLSGWFTTWRILLQVQVDGLLAAVEEYSAALRTANSSAKTPMDNQDGRGFRIVVVGDSTMRMQAEMMSYLLSSRRMNDGREQCETRVVEGDVAYARCKGNPPSSNDEGDIFSMEYVKNWNSCVVDEIDADFVYFGCGLHLLQLIPARTQEWRNLDTWVHYERLLEEAVLFYRSGGVRMDEPAREPIGIAFFTTHSIFDSALGGRYASLAREYRDKDPDLMAECRETVRTFEFKIYNIFGSPSFAVHLPLNMLRKNRIYMLHVDLFSFLFRVPLRLLDISRSASCTSCWFFLRRQQAHRDDLCNPALQTSGSVRAQVRAFLVALMWVVLALTMLSSFCDVSAMPHR